MVLVRGGLAEHEPWEHGGGGGGAGAEQGCESTGHGAASPTGPPLGTPGSVRRLTFVRTGVGGMLLASGEQRPGVLIDILQLIRAASQDRIVQPVFVVLRLRNLALAQI